MLWKTHIRLANEILYELGVPTGCKEAEEFREGSIAPDKWKNFPHHYGKGGTIRKCLLNARRHYLKGQMPLAFYNLGIAFHYIQDSYTSLTSRSPKHVSWEEQIEEAQLVFDLANLIEWAFRDRECLKQKYTHILRRLSENIQGEKATLELAVLEGHEYQDFGNPKVDLNLAFKSCASIAKSVLGEKTNQELQAHLSRILKEHETRLKESEIAFVDQTIGLIERRARTHNKRKTASGSMAPIRKCFLTIVCGTYDLRIGRRIKCYEKQKHLIKVTRSYETTTHMTTAPHCEWYSITVPPIDRRIVEKELFTTQEACKQYSITQQFVKYLEDTGRITLYDTKNLTYLRRSKLENTVKT